MRLEGIQIGDVVEVDRLGRLLYVLVTGNASAGLPVQPLDRPICSLVSSDRWLRGDRNLDSRLSVRGPPLLPLRHPRDQVGAK